MERKRVDVLELKFSNDSAAGEFEGYGAVFNNEDSHGDVIAKGAFKSSLSEWKRRGSLPKMLLQHGGGMFGGSADDLLPIGKWDSMEEDNKGLWCKGSLFALDTQRGKYIYEGLKASALDGLSIGFHTKEFTLGTKPGEPERTLKAVDLVEVSVVTFPSNNRALIQDVKALEELKSLADCEKFAREAFGCSRKAALAFVSTIKRIAQRDAAAGKVPDLLTALKQAKESFK
jgi:HK97 family phage prohead protease